MATTNKSRYAILGILSISPCSGYDIKKFCDKTISHFWNENFGHIYPMLKQLLSEGLIEQDEKQGDNRRKKYKITQNGKEELCTWLVQPTEPQSPRSEILLKLFFGNYISTAKVIEMIQEVRERHFSRLQEYKSLEKSYMNDKNANKDTQYVYWLVSLRYGIHASEATLKWCDETIQTLNNHHDI